MWDRARTERNDAVLARTATASVGRVLRDDPPDIRRLAMRTVALAFSITVLAAGAAHASEWAFDDSYWKKPDVATSFQEQSAPATTTDDSFEKYHQVDRYNP
jgi:hypothetical protein